MFFNWCRHWTGLIQLLGNGARSKARGNVVMASQIQIPVESSICFETLHPCQLRWESRSLGLGLALPFKLQSAMEGLNARVTCSCQRCGCATGPVSIVALDADQTFEAVRITNGSRVVYLPTCHVFVVTCSNLIHTTYKLQLTALY